ncbi:DegV family protein [Holdemania massiliensis]|uniref:DegV family EDD domain-containing protein n=1 Tax=Holdemania massiliensis TaxID=1468449 RepID=A0A6N7S3T4_9FIRM|nr:DegV family protein [Holdemania massiliensis]MSA70665.1 DegV family EDD domain-containing protein [Holdemania massiliensis]MSA88330.1 DegV family EDD domain-containing protein [Holdemania massiliensis]MSB77744.1 DegV family EDD domain-containing protein [Holdemania massiliensis]MSC32669.1 DegV family EDD domain-containing protein [Holdemania massiliensis]MSC38990.1 DegV family EDD domain-containing protein [Holdemania massiliensis]
MIRLISDSSTLYSIEEGKALPCDITPLCVTINGKTYREYEDIDAEAFLNLIKAGYIPSSSQPSMGELVELFEKYPEDEILVISMADGLSGTYQTAEAARLHTEHPERIHVVNSQTLCGPHRYLVDLAARLIHEGTQIEEILDTLQTKIATSLSFLLPQDFSYLKRGGRCTPMAAAMGGLLKLQPIMIQAEEGRRLEKFGVGRSFDAAIKSVLGHLEEHVQKARVQISVSHVFNKEQAEKILAKVKDRFPEAECVLYDLSCAFITQGGPRCIAIQSIEL